MLRRYPPSFLILTALGILCAIPGLLSLFGFGGLLHPVLDDPMAGLAFIVGGLLVAVAVIAWLVFAGGRAPAPSTPELNVDFNVPTPRLPEVPDRPAPPDLPRPSEPPQVAAPEPQGG